MITSSVLSAIPGLAHAFGTREDTAPLGRELMPNWKQVHGNAFAEARRPGQELGEIDALWSATPEVVIGVVTADCVPVLLARKDGAKVAAIHAGWRGTRARIIRAVWDGIRARATVSKGRDTRPFCEPSYEDASLWVAAIGPAIGPCCYEVSEELAGDFAREFCAGTGALLTREEALPMDRMLDLPAIAEAELRKLGFATVDRLNFCTKCTMDGGQPLLYSYRANPGEGRQLSQIRAARI